MKTRIMLLCISLLMMASSVPAWAVEHGILTHVWAKELVKSGNGEWDWSVPRPDSDGELPRGMAVDNQGRIYVSDSYNDRLLVFSSSGERREIVRVEKWIHFPEEIIVDKDNNLYVWGDRSDHHGYEQFLLSRSQGGWRTVSLTGKTYDFVPKSDHPEHFDRKIVPLGSDGFRVIPVLEERKWKYQIIDQHDKLAGFAPSIYQDKKGRYYDLLQNRYLSVFSQKGELKAKVDIQGSPAQLVPFRGYIYVYARHKLYRYGEDGSVEEEVTANSITLFSPCMASPLADYFYSYSAGDEREEYGLTVIRWKYEKATPESEKGTPKK